MLEGLPLPGILNETFQFTGKSAGCPAFLPVGRGGDESRPYNHIYISRKPRPVGEELHFLISQPLSYLIS